MRTVSVIKAMYEDFTMTVRVCQSGSASGLSPQSIAVYHCIRGLV